MAKLGQGFYTKLIQVASDVGMKPEDILNVMALESGLNPTAKHPTSGASGLNQMMPHTLEGLGFRGSPADFRDLAAENQLDYVEKLIKNNMKYNGGRPFSSAAQYYVANFTPAALVIPGIREGNPSTIIAAKNPTIAHIPNVSMKEEARIYSSNPVLDADKDGAITYGDIQTVMRNAAAGHNFQQAVADMRNYTGYEASPTKSSPSMIAGKDDLVKKYLDRIRGVGNEPSAQKPLDNKYVELDTILDDYLKQLAASDKNKRLYKQYLPNNNMLISISSPDYTNAIEFSRVLSNLLEKELLANAFVHTNKNQVEVECSIAGPTKECLEAVEQMLAVSAEAFNATTKKFGSGQISFQLLPNNKSSIQPISLKSAQLQHRKFLLKSI